jgi:hypothetical protein
LLVEQPAARSAIPARSTKLRAENRRTGTSVYGR